MKKPQILAIIPARGGSKGIKNKNERSFCGKPLIAHTIEVALKTNVIDRVIVSTDDPRIASIAKKHGAEVPFLRPKKYATDKSSIIETVIFTLDTLEKRDAYLPTHVLLLQPTNPMRTVEDIHTAVSLLSKRNADSVVSICRTENLLITKNAQDKLSILNPKLLRSPNRQQLPTYYKLDGCMIYLTAVKKLRETRSLFAGKLVGYSIERWRAVDIDEPEDFILGELIFSQQKEIRNALNKF